MKANYKILVVEDERIIALDIKRMLQNAGFGVTFIVDNVIDIMSHLDDSVPDLILMDVILKSSLDGIDAAKLISGSHNIPIVFLSAFKDESILKRVKETSAHEFLTKPIVEQKLIRVIKDVLEKEKNVKFS